MSFRNNNKRVDQSGQNLVELALILPFLVIVLFGVLDLGRVFFVTIKLTNAARGSVRFLTLHPQDVSSDPVFGRSREAAREEAGFFGITLLDEQIEVLCQNADTDADSCDSGLPATVNISYDFELVLGWMLPEDVHVTRTAVMIVP